jgi:hypothetical protein
MNWNEVEGNGRGLIQRTVPASAWRDRVNHEEPQDSLTLGRHLPEYEAGVIITRRQSSVYAARIM